MLVICGMIVGKAFNNGDVAVPVVGFKLLDLSNWQYSQISLFDLIKNNNNIGKPMNLVDTLERWHRCKRSDFSPELCVNSKFLLFRGDYGKWSGLHIKLPLFNPDGSFYMFDNQIFRLNDISEDIGVYIDLSNLSIKLIYKGYDISNGVFTCVKSVYKVIDKNTKYGIGGSLWLDGTDAIRGLWKTDGNASTLGKFICRVECGNISRLQIPNRITLAELSGCSGCCIELPESITRVEVTGKNPPRNIELHLKSSVEPSVIVGIVGAFIKSPVAYNELRTSKSMLDIVNICKNYKLKLVIH